MGAVFWPDYWHPQNTMFYINSESVVWQLLDMPFVDMFEQESGQLLIDRRRHSVPLHLVSFYAFHQPNYFQLQRLAWGDKDLFRFAWLKLEVPFFMVQTPPSIAGTVIGWSFCGMTMVQHDTNGNVLFLHRNQRKLMGKLHPKLVEALDKKLSLVGIEALLDDGRPDPEIWTHLLSFRNTSARSEYMVYGESGLPGFPKWQRCYGRRDLDRNPHFYTQKFSDLSFGGIEKQLRKYAFEAVQLQQQK
ncbi:putative Mannosyltransferase [Phytophthora infestans]|uniref:Putative Mannosyltransferase n=1 Tax=Phytophthora infestans TaxID=4787 RepID=A0A8S9TTT1_PHYIN|nr:putative Mannosyltransferase [Phytophthora infestans]